MNLITIVDVDNELEEYHERLREISRVRQLLPNKIEGVYFLAMDCLSIHMPANKEVFYSVADIIDNSLGDHLKLKCRHPSVYWHTITHSSTGGDVVVFSYLPVYITQMSKIQLNLNLSSGNDMFGIANHNPYAHNNGIVALPGCGVTLPKIPKKGNGR